MSTYNITRCGLEYRISKPFGTIKIIRLSYQDIKCFEYQSFLVYILVGKDSIYIGKSKNGMLNRPTAHTSNWDEVYFIIDESDSFNDGIIQYLENAICNRINRVNTYNNLTKLTNVNTSSNQEYSYIKAELNDIYYMLYALGLDLVHERLNIPKLESGLYNITHKSFKNQVCEAYVRVFDDYVTILKDSEISDGYNKNCKPEIIRLRENYSLIELNILQKDIKLNNILDAVAFILGKKISDLHNIDIKKVS